MPKKIYNKKGSMMFARQFQSTTASLKIPIEWVKEYNELLETHNTGSEPNESSVGSDALLYISDAPRSSHCNKQIMVQCTKCGEILIARKSRIERGVYKHTCKIKNI